MTKILKKFSNFAKKKKIIIKLKYRFLIRVKTKENLKLKKLIKNQNLICKFLKDS